MCRIGRVCEVTTKVLLSPLSITSWQVLYDQNFYIWFQLQLVGTHA
jgi:hypothetical protein